MKIQNNRARIWIALGLIGLILWALGIRGMFVDASLIFLVAGWWLESKKKK